MSEHEIAETQAETEPDTTDPKTYEAEAPEEAPSSLEAEEPSDLLAEKSEPPRQIEQDGKKYVTLEALQEERRKNREEAQRHEQRLRDMEERFLRLREEEPAVDTIDIPDPSEDIIGATAALREQFYQQHQRQQEERQQVEARTREEELRTNVQRMAIGQVEAYKREHPEYNDAYRHLVDSRRAFYEAMGVGPEDLSNILSQEEFNIAHQLLANNRSVPEAVMEMARRSGWQPQAQKEDKIQRVSEGQKQAQTLSQGGEVSAKRDIRWLESLSDDEFAAVPDKVFREIMGG